MANVMLVTGIGASGTSCVAGCLHKMGVSMGLHLSTHPAGFDLYEDTCLHGIFGLPEPKQRMALRRYALTHFRSDGPFGAKNTLLWKSFPWSLNMLRDMGHEPRVVVSHRTFERSVRGRMEGRCPPGRFYDRDEATAWAVEAYLGLLSSLYGIQDPVLHVSYETLLEDPAGEVGRLAAFAGVDVTDEAIAHVRRN